MAKEFYSVVEWMDNGDQNWKFCHGYYQSKEKAEARLEEVRKKNGIVDHRAGGLSVRVHEFEDGEE